MRRACSRVTTLLRGLLFLAAVLVTAAPGAVGLALAAPTSGPAALEACAEKGKPIILVREDDTVVRGTLIDCTDRGFRVLVGDRVETVPADEVAEVLVDVAALPVPAPASSSDEADRIRTGKVLALSLGLLLPGIGQIAMGKDELGAVLLPLGLGGLVTSSVIGIMYAADEVTGSDEPTLNPILGVALGVWFVSYAVGAVDALTTEVPSATALAPGPGLRLARGGLELRF